MFKGILWNNVVPVNPVVPPPPGLIDGDLAYNIPNPDDYSSSGDQFGLSVGTCDSYTIAGAPYEDTASDAATGRAYIYDNSDGSLLYTLDAPGTPAAGAPTNDYFGMQVDICESYAIVWAQSYDGTPSGDSPEAYIYDTSDGSLLWTISYIGPDFAVAKGPSVSITEDYAMIADSIYDPATGNFLRTLTDPNPGGQFGLVSQVSDNFAIVTDTQYQHPSYPSGGAEGIVYIFDPSDDTLLHTINHPDPANGANDGFGRSAGICNEYAIVGEPEWNDGATLEIGRAYIYDTSDGSLLYTLDNPLDEAAGNFGNSVDATRSYAIVGAEYNDEDAITNGGGVYIYDMTHPDGPQGELMYTFGNPVGTKTNERYGHDVAIGQQTAVVGAPWTGSGANKNGAIYIYD